MSELLNQLNDALDGMPAQAVMSDYLHASAQGRAAGTRAWRLTEHILAQWIDSIERDLARFPSPTMDVLQSIRQRMAETRDALLRLQWLIHDLNLGEASQDLRHSGVGHDAQSRHLSAATVDH